MVGPATDPGLLLLPHEDGAGAHEPQTSASGSGRVSASICEEVGELDALVVGQAASDPGQELRARGVEPGQEELVSQDEGDRDARHVCRPRGWRALLAPTRRCQSTSLRGEARVGRLGEVSPALGGRRTAQANEATHGQNEAALHPWQLEVARCRRATRAWRREVGDAERGEVEVGVGERGREAKVRGVRGSPTRAGAASRRRLGRRAERRAVLRSRRGEC